MSRARSTKIPVMAGTLLYQHIMSAGNLGDSLRQVRHLSKAQQRISGS